MKMMNHGTLRPLRLVMLLTTACCFVFAAASGEPTEEQPVERSEREKAGDVFCGPRCASFVLSHYGKQADLLDLVDEIQDRDWRKGSTLAAIDKALRARGLYTAAMRLSTSADLSWPEPAIVHINAEAREIGHFVVALPDASDGHDVTLWCGLSGTRVVSTAWMRARRSGAMLLVSARPIETPDGCVRRVWQKLVLPALLAAAPLIFVIVRRGSRICRHFFAIQGTVP